MKTIAAHRAAGPSLLDNAGEHVKQEKSGLGIGHAVALRDSLLQHFVDLVLDGAQHEGLAAGAAIGDGRKGACHLQR